MKNVIIITTAFNALFLIMHEYDAFHQGEWRMFKFLQGLKEDSQYALFLYLHIPLTLFCFYYLWITIQFIHFPVWLSINIFSIGHLLLHLIARKWKTNVFTSLHSFIFILGWAATGVMNLLIMNHY